MVLALLLPMDTIPTSRTDMDHAVVDNDIGTTIMSWVTMRMIDAVLELLLPNDTIPIARIGMDHQAIDH